MHISPSKIFVGTGSGAILATSTDKISFSVVASYGGYRIDNISGNEEQIAAVGRPIRDRSAGTRATLERMAKSTALVSISPDNGRTWVRARNLEPGILRDIYVNDALIVAVGHRVYFAVELDGSRKPTDALIAISRDRGRTWRFSTQQPGRLSSVTGAKSFVILSGYEAGIGNTSYGLVMSSFDYGKSWRKEIFPQPINSVSFNDQNILAVGGGARYGRRLYRSIDNALTWFQEGRENTVELTSLAEHNGAFLALAGQYGAIFDFVPAGQRIPWVSNITLTMTDWPQGAKATVEVSDPDNLCESQCELQLMGEREWRSGAASEPVSLATTNEINHADVWRATINIKQNLGIISGDILNISARLSSPSFTRTQPEGNKKFATEFRIKEHSTIYWYAASLLILIVGLVYWLRPMWILRLYSSELFTSIGFSTYPWLSGSLSVLSNITLVPWLVHREHILNAWVERNEQSENWKSPPSPYSWVEYYPLPLNLIDAENRRTRLEPSDFTQLLKRSQRCIEISGSGGSGKTTLAAEIVRSIDKYHRKEAKHGTLALWSKYEVPNEQWIYDTVCQKSDFRLPKSFVKKLLERRRMVLVMDGLSERYQAPKEIINAVPSCVSLKVVTIRRQLDYDERVCKIQTAPLQPSEVPRFLQYVLQSHPGLPGGWSLRKQVQLSSNFSDVLTAGNAEISVTPLLVVLFVDRALKGNACRNVPKTIPDVYFEYIRELFQNDNSDEKVSVDDLTHAAGIAAIKEVGDDFRPKSISKRELERILSERSLNGPRCISALIDAGVFEEIWIGGKAFVHFSLDPVAEYVSAYELASQCGSDKDEWARLWLRVYDAGQAADGFLHALAITWLAYHTKLSWPMFNTVGLPHDIELRIIEAQGSD